MIQRFIKSLKHPPHDLGRMGEKEAICWLKNMGWHIKAQNWRASRYAEIDAIAYDPEGNLVFIEIKTRYRPKDIRGFADHGIDSINYHKRRKLVLAAQIFCSRYKLFDVSYRFDALIVYYSLPIDIHSVKTKTKESPDTPSIQHISNIIN